MRTVLHAEDDATVRMLSALVLTQAGYDVTSVESAEQALLLLASCSFDIVMTDHRMIGLTGLDVVRAARGASARTAIVACSATFDPDICRRYREAGVDAFLPKPFGVDELLAIVRELVSENGSAAAA